MVCVVHSRFPRAFLTTAFVRPYKLFVYHSSVLVWCRKSFAPRITSAPSSVVAMLSLLFVSLPHDHTHFLHTHLSHTYSPHSPTTLRWLSFVPAARLRLRFPHLLGCSHSSLFPSPWTVAVWMDGFAVCSYHLCRRYVCGSFFLHFHAFAVVLFMVSGLVCSSVSVAFRFPHVSPTLPLCLIALPVWFRFHTFGSPRSPLPLALRVYSVVRSTLSRVTMQFTSSRTFIACSSTPTCLCYISLVHWHRLSHMDGFLRLVWIYARLFPRWDLSFPISPSPGLPFGLGSSGLVLHPFLFAWFAAAARSRAGVLFTGLFVSHRVPLWFVYLSLVGFRHLMLHYHTPRLPGVYIWLVCGYHAFALLASLFLRSRLSFARLPRKRLCPVPAAYAAFTTTVCPLPSLFLRVLVTINILVPTHA